MPWLCAVLIAIAGLINLVPVVGVLSVAWLSELYGIPVSGSDLEILMRHRAVVLGATGVLLLTSALRPSLRQVAAAMGFASMLSFEAIAWQVGGFNAELSRIVAIDWLGIASLLGGMVLHYINVSRPAAA